MNYNLLDAFHDLYSYIEYYGAKLLKVNVNVNSSSKNCGQVYLTKIELVKVTQLLRCEKPTVNREFTVAD